MAVSRVYPWHHTGPGHISTGAGSSLQTAETVTLGIRPGMKLRRGCTGSGDPQEGV